MGKRSRRSTKTRSSDKTIYVIAGVLVLVIGVIVFAVAKPTSKVTSDSEVSSGEFDEFASCLTEKGAIFYGTEWCGFCQQQKAMFGESMNKVNFVDCDQNRNLCVQEGISGYPTWKINNQMYPGLQQLSRLSQLSGCEIA